MLFSINCTVWKEFINSKTIAIKEFKFIYFNLRNEQILL